MSKVGVIRIELEYDMEKYELQEEFYPEFDNKKIVSYLQNVELPDNYIEDTYEYVGIWNKKTTEWEVNEGEH